uniref:Uncharacterized protein n=1 Tax=Panagrolaimus sp. ES5 TaxID=591445 RepID=A0AC34G9Q3_9BILA
MTRKSKRSEDTAAAEPSMPMYKQALLRMCQFQIRICSKIIEIHCLKHHDEPETLKHAARRTILNENSQPLKVVDALVDTLPRELLTFLRVGIPPWEVYLSTNL